MVRACGDGVSGTLLLVGSEKWVVRLKGQGQGQGKGKKRSLVGIIPPAYLVFAYIFVQGVDFTSQSLV
jgi:hypothetical protein